MTFQKSILSFILLLTPLDSFKRGIQMIKISKLWREKKLFFFLLIPITLLITYYYSSYSPKEEQIPLQTIELNELPPPQQQPQVNKTQLADEIIVDVKGQVVKPGVYTIVENSRVNDVITIAGGLTENADRNQVNLAQIVTDEMVIYVPSKGEQVFTPITTSSASSDGLISINNADESQLDSLPGIGPSKAQAIIAYREENGPFKTIEDIKNVPGIGDKTFENFADLITVK